MAIQYFMRAYNTATLQYVDWVVNDQPDSVGTFAPGGPSNLTNIIVNRTVSSKVDNILNPFQSTTMNGTVVLPSGTINVVSTALFPPAGTLYIGIGNPPTTFTTVTYTGVTPTSFTGVTGGSGSAHTGNPVISQPLVSNAGSSATYDNPADPFLLHINGYDWLNPIAPTTSLPQMPTGVAIVRGSGQPYSTLVWNENLSQWEFVQILTNGSVGPYQSVSMGITNVVGYLGVQDTVSDPESSTGLIRIPDNQFMKSRNASNTGDVFLIGADATNRVQLGSATDPVHVPGPDLQVDNFIVAGTSTTTVAQTEGFIRLNNAILLNAWRNSGNSGDLAGLSTTGNTIVLGDANNTGIQFKVGTGTPVAYNFIANGLDLFDINLNTTTSVATLSFGLTTATPLITQATTGGAGGQPLTVQAQNASTTGGNLNLSGGTGATAGSVNLQTGGTTELQVNPTNVTQNNALYTFAPGVTLPIINQTAIATAGSTTTQLTVQAQNNTSAAANSFGSTLALTSGTSGVGAGNAGSVLVQTGGVSQIVVTPSTTTINNNVVLEQNLTVLGTTTTIDSTIVDIEGRVVHANWTASTSIRAPIVPTGSITGYTINRGSPTGGGPSSFRDSAGLIYTEITDLYNDGYWKHATVLQDNDVNLAVSALVATMPVMGAAYFATPNPNNEISATKAQLPSAGGFRSLNNTIAVSSRNAAFTQDLRLIGTDAANHIILGETPTPQNAGMQFYTTTASLYDFFVNNVSEVQLSSDANGPFIRESATTFVPAVSAFVRVPNNTLAVAARNAANTNDLVMLSTDAANHIIMGDGTPFNAGFIFNTTTGSLYDYQTASVSEVQLGSDTNGPFVRESATTFVPAVSGFVRVPNAITAVAARNAGNTNDILLVGTDNLNHILHGDSVAPTNGGHIFSTTTNSIFDFWVNGLSQVSIGASEINFTNTDGYATIQQSPTFSSNVTGGTFSILAQSVLGSNGIGGNLVLSSGFGGLIDGYIDLQVAGVTVAAVEPNKFTFVQGKRRHITQITGTYNVQVTDDYIAITSLTTTFNVFLPAFGTPAGPYIGDEYEIKDTTGNAGTFNVTVFGNGTNIDANATFVLNQPYAAAKFTFTGTTWSVS